MSTKVYFSRTITPEKVLELYQMIGQTLPGKVAVKLHSGEKGNQNFLGPDFWKPVIDFVGGTVYDSEKNPVSVPKDLVEQADKALYASKRNGRNMVSFADSDVINNIEIPK